MQKLTSFGFWTGKSMFSTFFRVFFNIFPTKMQKMSNNDLLVKIDVFRLLDGQINFFFFVFSIFFCIFLGKCKKKSKKDLLVKIDFFRLLDGQINCFSTCFFSRFFLHFPRKMQKNSRKKVDLLVKIDVFRLLDGQINSLSTFFFRLCFDFLYCIFQIDVFPIDFSNQLFLDFFLQINSFPIEFHLVSPRHNSTAQCYKSADYGPGLQTFPMIVINPAFCGNLLTFTV